MKKTKQALFFLSFLSFFGFSFGINLPNTIANIFPDPNLAQVIASTLSGGKTTGSIVSETDLNTIKTLVATGKNISVISGIETLKNIEYINFSLNSISGELPSLFSGLTQLTGLLLQNNQIKFLSEDVFSGLVNCKQLRISYNEIGDFPSKVFYPLSSLEDLAIGHNLNTTLPEDIFWGVPSLKNLYTEYGVLTGISPNIFSGLNNLKVLYINNNQFSTIPEGIFSGLKKLETLLIGGNQFKSLPPKLLYGLTELKDFRMAINQVSTLPENFFSGLTKMTYMRLDNNKFKYLPKNIFSGMVNLTGVLLNTNQLRNLPVNIFDNMPLLGKITINKNCLISGMLDTTTYSKILSTNSGAFPTQYGIGSSYCPISTGVLIPDLDNIANELIWMGYKQGTGSLKTISSDTFVGNKSLDISQVNGNILVPIILQSSGSSNKYEVEFSSGTFVKTTSGSEFTGTIDIPTFKNTGTILGVTGKIISAVSIGSTTSLFLKDKYNQDSSAVIRMPAPGMRNGDLVKIIYSNDNWTNKSLQTYTYVTMINNEPYVEFPTTHFTDFAVIGFNSGMFIINNDLSGTENRNVTLNIYHPITGSSMRFSNDNINRSSWESYATSKSRTLSDVSGQKTVYAEFDTNSDGNPDYSVSDSIQLKITTKGQIMLQIEQGVSECVYGTSLYLGSQDIKIGSTYGFSGDFNGQWYCSDFEGDSSGWAFTIQASDLINEKNNIIPGSNILISHKGISRQGTDACTGFNGSPSPFYATPISLIEKISGNDKICKVTLSSVGLSVVVPANQAPGSYVGTLTLTIPSF